MGSYGNVFSDASELELLPVLILPIGSAYLAPAVYVGRGHQLSYGISRND